MSARKLLAAAWQHCRLLLALAAGLFFGYRFMTGESTNLWITPPACIVAFLGGGLNLVGVILNRGKMPVRIIEIPGSLQEFERTSARKNACATFGWLDLLRGALPQPRWHLHVHRRGSPSL